MVEILVLKDQDVTFSYVTHVQVFRIDSSFIRNDLRCLRRRWTSA